MEKLPLATYPLRDGRQFSANNSHLKLIGLIPSANPMQSDIAWVYYSLKRPVAEVLFVLRGEWHTGQSQRLYEYREVNDPNEIQQIKEWLNANKHFIE